MSAEEIHKHKPKDVKPQGANSGLDADKLDGLHAYEISGGGGGPHAASHETGGSDKVHFAELEHSSIDVTLHDALTSIPHISQAEKDKIHDRLHALDSASDHSGTITDAQHGIRGSGLHADSHAQLHKDSHKSGGGDAFALADMLDCLARLEVKKAGVSIGKRRGFNLIEGANVTLTVADDAENEEVDVTIASAGGGGAAHNVAYVESTTDQTITAGSSAYLNEMDYTFPVHANKRIIVMAQASFSRSSGSAGDVVLQLYEAGYIVSGVSIYIALTTSEPNMGRYAGFIFHTWVPSANENIRYRLIAYNGCAVSVLSQGSHLYFRRKMMIMELVS
jgi:hypothetical protein